MENNGIICKITPGEYSFIENSFARISIKETKEIIIGSGQKLYSEFSALPTTLEHGGIKAIVNFYNRYGFLGTSNYNDYPSSHLVHSSNKNLHYAEYAELTLFHISLMQAVLWALENIKNTDDYEKSIVSYYTMYAFLETEFNESYLYDHTNYMLSSLYEKWLSHGPTENMFKTIRKEIDMCELQGEIVSITVLTVNQFLKNVYPMLADDGQSLNISTKWEAKNLLSAMYFEIFLAYCSNKTIRKCTCGGCPNYFEVSSYDTRKKYCSMHCAQLEAKRKQRQREKLQKLRGEPNGNSTKER